MGLSIAEAADADAVRALWPVLRELRPHLAEDALVDAVASQREEGYRLVGAWRDGAPHGAAGFRVQQMLAHGRFLYVDDLVTIEACRGQGVGKALLDWLLAQARQLGCASLQLDSGSWRHRAHAFYFARGLHVSSLHFVRALND